MVSLAAVLIFLSFATSFGSKGMVGSYGVFFSQLNVLYFGYLAHVYLVFLLYPLYRFYQNPKISVSRIESFLSFSLLFFVLLILQALLVVPPHEGRVGSSIVLFLKPLIGIAGVLLFLLMTTVLALIIAFDLSIEDGEKALVRWLRGKKESFENRKKKRKESFMDSEIIEDEPIRIDSEGYKDTLVEEIVPIEQDEMVEKRLLDPEIAIPHGDGYAEQVKLVRREGKEVSCIEQAEVEPEPPEQQSETGLPSISESEKLPSEDVGAHVSHVQIVHELEENKRLLDEIEVGENATPDDFKLPPLDMLQASPKDVKPEINESEIDQKIEDLLDKLHRFKIEGDVVRTYAGPVVTTFEFKPAPHVKVSKILTLEDDLAMALRAKTIRIQAPVPGKDVVGIEIPNINVLTIYLREVLESDIFTHSKSPLTIALGKDIVGKSFVTDLKKLPHLLIAGTTGSGKSVGINAMILSLLYKNSPDNLRLLMIDPKMLEFSIYNDIPHLLTPVITQAKQAVVALSNMVGEMERRYQLMSKAKTKNIENYNEKAEKMGFEPFPYIVVIIDELADLMMTSGKDVEFSIARLAQMARASGIHLIVATQRPSVDVVTGLIKANLPSRISYKVGQKIDSKVILDAFGAESLLGRGDMLFTPPGSSGLVRLHAPWSSEEEIENIAEFIKAQRPAEYVRDFIDEESELSKGPVGVLGEIELDEMFDEAKQIVLSERKTSISYIQRRLQIGYNRAARIVEQLEQTGVLSAPNAKGNREILE